MKIKRFYADDIRQAIRKVREDQGDDAVILSNRRVDGGIEIVAAVNYDETLLNNTIQNATTNYSYEAPEDNQSTIIDAAAGISTEKHTTSDATNHVPLDDYLSQDPAFIEMQSEIKNLRSMLEEQLSGFAWGDLNKRNPRQAELMKRLMGLGLSVSFCQEILGNVSPELSLNNAWRDSLKQIVDGIPISDQDLLNVGGVVALVGPTGVGKTTTIAKIAARFALKHGNRQVGLITIDNFRVAAYEQLRTYGKILDIPVRTVENNEDLRKTLNDFCDKRLVLIDTAGMGQRDIQLIDQLSILGGNDKLIRKSLVVSSATRLSAMDEIIDAFKIFNPESCILTKLDETTNLGSVLSAVISHQLPVSYLSDGQHVPEDLHIARSNILVSKCLEIVKDKAQFLHEEIETQKFERVTANAFF